MLPKIGSGRTVLETPGLSASVSGDIMLNHGVAAFDEPKQGVQT
jgi:hypothetical protein